MLHIVNTYISFFKFKIDVSVFTVLRKNLKAIGKKRVESGFVQSITRPDPEDAQKLTDPTDSAPEHGKYPSEYSSTVEGFRSETRIITK